MSDRVLFLSLAAIMLAAVLGWHFTPWKYAALWGAFGCASAARNHIVVEGCGPPPPTPSCTDRCMAYCSEKP